MVLVTWIGEIRAGRSVDIMIFFSILISFSSIVHDIFHVYNIQIFIHTHAILHFYANKIILSVKQLHMAVSKEKNKAK